VQSTGQGRDGQKDGLINDYVNTVVADKRNIYCATVGGLSIYDPAVNKWRSFDSENSALPTPYIFNLDKKNERLWLVNSNYWSVYYEPATAGNEKGSLVSYNASHNDWKSFTGTRKKLTSDTTFVELKGDIPSPNSDFGNVALDDSGNVWFSFGGGVGVLRKQLWQIYNRSTCGIDFGWVSDIAIANSDVWVACEKGLLQNNKTDDTWIVHEKGSDKIPGTVLTSIYVSDNSVWIKSYDPNYWAKQGLFEDPSRKDALKVRGVNHRLNIDGNTVDIKCLNQEDWQKAYHPKYMEFLTVCKDNKWQSWELTRKLIDELTK
jgi:ligand-binding sensor domain-containing protein